MLSFHLWHRIASGKWHFSLQQCGYCMVRSYCWYLVQDCALTVVWVCDDGSFSFLFFTSLVFAHLSGSCFYSSICNSTFSSPFKVAGPFLLFLPRVLPFENFWLTIYYNHFMIKAEWNCDFAWPLKARLSAKCKCLLARAYGPTTIGKYFLQSLIKFPFLFILCQMFVSL